MAQVMENQFGESENAETRRMVRLAKEKEARMAESMGYNPFEARLMGNTVRGSEVGVRGERVIRDP